MYFQTMFLLSRKSMSRGIIQGLGDSASLLQQVTVTVFEFNETQRAFREFYADHFGIKKF